MGLRPSSRLKTPNTIIEKLVREKTRLGSMQDIAGIRIVEAMTIPEQDNLVAQIVNRLDGEVVDRRARRSHGYRAVHIIVTARGCLVEIQVRTLLQNLWAQIMETLGDRIGRGIRYGEMPDDQTLRDTVARLIELSSFIAIVEEAHAALERQEDVLREPASVADEDTREEFEAALAEYEELGLEINAMEPLLRRLLEGILASLEGGESQ